MASSKPIRVELKVHEKLKQLCVRLNLDMGWVASNMINEGVERAERLKTLPMAAAFGEVGKPEAVIAPPKERVRIALGGLLAEREEVAHWELLKVRGMGILKKDLVGLIEELGEYDKVWITAEDGKDAGYGWKRKVEGLAV